MKKIFQIVFLIIAILMALYILSQIQELIICLFIALVLSISINPINNFLCKKLNKTISAIICLLIITTISGTLAYLMSPIITNEIETIEVLIENPNKIQNSYQTIVNEIVKKAPFIPKEILTINLSQLKLKDFISTSIVLEASGHMLSLVLSFLSILFISFFLIKDKVILKEKAIRLTSYFFSNSKNKINTSIYFIRRYFIGLCIQTTILFVLFGLGMYILGLPNPWTLALFASIINIIPFFGPIIGCIFTIIIIGTTALTNPQELDIIYSIIKTLCLFGSIQAIDNFILQPNIYAKAFKTHPLEIFFIALTAGFIGGLVWMIIAMPLYTIIRIIFAELMTQLQETNDV